MTKIILRLIIKQRRSIIISLSKETLRSINLNILKNIFILIFLSIDFLFFLCKRQILFLNRFFPYSTISKKTNSSLIFLILIWINIRLFKLFNNWLLRSFLSKRNPSSWLGFISLFDINHFLSKSLFL